MDILFDILIIIAAIIVGAVGVILIVAFLGWLLSSIVLATYPDCNGMCEHCNEELKEICKENKHDN